MKLLCDELRPSLAHLGEWAPPPPAPSAEHGIWREVVVRRLAVQVQADEIGDLFLYQDVP